MEENIYIHYGNTRFDKELFKPIKNALWNKPHGGFWASPINAKYSWKDWNECSDFRKCREDNCFRFRLKDNVKVCTINNVTELDLLPMNKKMEEIYGFKIGSGLISGDEMRYLDFEELITLGYDAILVNVSSDDHLYWALYGWDCDSLLVLNKDVVEEI